MKYSSATMKMRNLLYLLTMSCCLLVANCLPVPDSIAEEGELFEGDILLVNQNNNKRGKRDNMIMQDIAPTNAEVGGMAGATGEGETNETEQFDAEQASGGLWPDKTVYYKIDKNIGYAFEQIYLSAIEAWEGHTCLKFVKAKPDTKAYLNLTTDDGSCSSYIGRIGTAQKVTISHKCSSVGHAIHELGHAIGLWHEHTRPDRNKYIKVVWDNIKKDRAYNFLIYNHPNMPKNIGYDFASIMHYEENAFAINRKKPTIEVLYKPLPSCLPKIGQRYTISYKDALKVNKMYNCTNELNSNETDPCTLPPPAPTPTATSVTPSPTPTTSSSTSVPKPTCITNKAVKSESLISFQFVEASGLRLGCNGDYCEKLECTDHASIRVFTCDAQFFTIYLASNKKNRHIKDGDTVALRSLKRANYWVDCSRGNCTLSTCPENDGGKTITNYTRDICSQHKFKIRIANLRKTKKPKRIKTSDIFYLEAIDSEKYLNCYGRKCQLITENGDCDTETDNSGSSGSLCSRQYFNIEKTATHCSK